MMKNTRVTIIRTACTTCSALAVSALMLLPAAASASGSGGASMPMRTEQRQQMTPEQEAIVLYNDGISYRDKAAKFEKEAETEADSGKRQKLEGKAKDKHED